MGTLYLVATPIGNLEDITLRAMRVLAEVSLIAAEDTRRTRKLLAHFDIHTPLTSYFEHNKLAKLDAILGALARGDVALVSDAGTPALNDPGYELVRVALEAGHNVSPLPGPNAPLAALIASGLPTEAFLYLGYLPRKSSERRQALEAVRELPYTLIFLEAPHRLNSALRDLLDVLGDRQAAVARELTKLHEEIFRSTLSQAVQHFEQHPPRGEITLVLSGQPPHEVYWSAEQLEEVLPGALDSGEPLGRLAARLSAESGWPRRKVYQMLLDLKQNAGS